MSMLVSQPRPLHNANVLLYVGKADATEYPLTNGIALLYTVFW